MKKIVLFTLVTGLLICSTSVPISAKNSDLRASVLKNEV
ncbi:Uncharacterised protein [Brevibacillus brevis]|nr:Uncharacterised protein [Brevibacillus brevis]